MPPINEGFGLIDLIMNNGDDETWSFTVNNLVTNVAMVAPIGDGLLEKADFLPVFQRADHFRILSFGCHLPLGFEFWPNDIAGDFRPPKLTLQAKIGVPRNPVSIEPSTIWMPYENYEMALGSYNNLDISFFTDWFTLHATFDTGQGQNVSMINVPDDLNGLTFRCPLYLKVEHTLPLIGFP